MKSRHSRTSLSILRNSAGIKIVTAFLMSSLGPEYYEMAELAKPVFSESLLLAELDWLFVEELLPLFWLLLLLHF